MVDAHMIIDLVRTDDKRKSPLPSVSPLTSHQEKIEKKP